MSRPNMHILNPATGTTSSDSGVWHVRMWGQQVTIKLLSEWTRKQRHAMAGYDESNSFVGQWGNHTISLSSVWEVWRWNQKMRRNEIVRTGTAYRYTFWWDSTQLRHLTDMNQTWKNSTRESIYEIDKEAQIDRQTDSEFKHIVKICNVLISTSWPTVCRSAAFLHRILCQ